MGLEMVEIVLCLEKYFQAQIPDSAASQCNTVVDLQQVIIDLLVLQGMPRTDGLRQEVWQGMMSVLRIQGYDTGSIVPDSRWVGDITDYG